MRRLFVLDSRCADNTQDCRQSGNLSQCSAKCDTISHRAIQGGSHRRLVTALMWYQLLQQMTVVCYSAAGHCWLCWYCWPLLQEVFKYWNICLFSERKKNIHWPMAIYQRTRHFFTCDWSSPMSSSGSVHDGHPVVLWASVGDHFCQYMDIIGISDGHVHCKTYDCIQKRR